MTAYYSAEIKIAIFNPFRNANMTNKDCCQIAVELHQKLHILTA